MSDFITKRGSREFQIPMSQPPMVFDLGGTPTNSFEIFRKLRRRKLLIALVALVVFVPSAVVTYMATPLYASSTLIQVNPDSVQVLPYRDIADSASGVYYEVYMSTQDQALRSSNLIDRVASALRTSNDTKLVLEAPWLSGRYLVKRMPNSQLFQLSYRAPSPIVAAQVVNIFADEYIKLQMDLRKATREKAREALQKELKELEGRVQTSERALVSYARRENMVNAGPGQGDLVQRRMASLDQQVAEATSEVVVARNRLEIIQKASLRSFPDKLQNPVIASLAARLLQAEHELVSLRASFGENWPAVVSKRDEISLIQQQLTRERTSALAQAVEQGQLDLQAAQSKLGSVTSAFADQVGLLHSYNNASIEYNIRRREVETNQKLYEGVLERLSQTTLHRGFEFSNVIVVEPGKPNLEVESPKVWYNLILGALLGLTLGIGAAFLRDFWDSSISTLEEAQEVTRLPGLGTVPSSKFFTTMTGSSKGGVRRQLESGWMRLGSGGKPQDGLPPPHVLESIRDICTSILLSQSDQPMRVIAVTSALPGEGKTTVIREIGRVFAESGARTLLVEADLRKPMLAAHFGIDESDGLSLYLSGHVPTPRICETDQPNLFVAPAGPPPPNPVSLLGSERMNNFLKQMNSSFRFVLLDTPPALVVADARIVGAKADGLVLVSRARRTSKNQIARTRAILMNSGINVLGLVLNCADTDELRPAFHSYYSDLRDAPPLPHYPAEGVAYSNGQMLPHTDESVGYRNGHTVTQAEEGLGYRNGQTLTQTEEGVGYHHNGHMLAQTSDSLGDLGGHMLTGAGDSLENGHGHMFAEDVDDVEDLSGPTLTERADSLENGNSHMLAANGDTVDGLKKKMLVPTQDSSEDGNQIIARVAEGAEDDNSR
jgi:polysaccharide biosynthesis transport protein